MVFSFNRSASKNNGKTISSPPKSLRSVTVNKGNKVDKDVAVKKSGFKATSGAKYSLIIGDEGAILLYIVGKQVQSRNFVANASAENLKEFENILAKNKKAPIYLVVDSMDQSFIKQSLPPISSLGVKKLIKRRLDRDLGANVIKGYVLLDRDSGGRRDWNFLMVSLENSPHLNLWFEFIEKVDNRLNGIYLLSVEAENIIKTLDIAMGLPKADKKKSTDSQWKFFVTHNKVGGFRQVILKDGKIIFTRLTQPVGEVTPEVIAGNIEQEMASTIEYMKRLSFNSQQGLDIYIIASAEINNAIDASKIPSKKLYKFTPFEVSEFFGITGAAQLSDQFGDVILSAFIACSKIHRLVLSLPKAAKVNQIYSVMQYQKALAGLLLLGIIGYSGFVGVGLLQKYSDIEDLNQKKLAQQRKFDQVNEEINKNGIDIKKIDDTVTLYKKIGSEAKSPIPFFQRLRPAIIESVAIKEFLWELGKSPDAGAVAPAGGNNSNLGTVTVVLHFPDIIDSEEAFNVIAKKVLNDVRTAFPDYKVSYSKLPEVFTKKSEAGEITFDDEKKVVKIDKQDLNATLTLTQLMPDQIANPASIVNSDQAIQNGTPNIHTMPNFPNFPVNPNNPLNGAGNQ